MRIAKTETEIKIWLAERKLRIVDIAERLSSDPSVTNAAPSSVESMLSTMFSEKAWHENLALGIKKYYRVWIPRFPQFALVNKRRAA